MAIFNVALFPGVLHLYRGQWTQKNNMLVVNKPKERHAKTHFSQISENWKTEKIMKVMREIIFCLEGKHNSSYSGFLKSETMVARKMWHKIVRVSK